MRTAPYHDSQTGGNDILLAKLPLTCSHLVGSSTICGTAGLTSHADTLPQVYQPSFLFCPSLDAKSVQKALHQPQCKHNFQDMVLVWLKYNRF